MKLDKIDQFVGQKYTEMLGWQIKTETGARTLRVLEPNMCATMDLQGDRLDVYLDKSGAIIQFKSS